MVTMKVAATMGLLVRLGALFCVTVPLTVVASVRDAVKWIGSRTRMPSRPSLPYYDTISVCRCTAATTTTATTTFVGSAWNNYGRSSTWCGSCTPTGKRQRNDMYLPEPSLGSSHLSHVRCTVSKICRVTRMPNGMFTYKRCKQACLYVSLRKPEPDTLAGDTAARIMHVHMRS